VRLVHRLRSSWLLARSRAPASGAVVAGLLVVIGLAEVVWVTGGLTPTQVLVVALLALPLAWRVTAPCLVVGVVTAALVAQVPWSSARLFHETFTGFVCVLVAFYALGRHARSRWAVPVLAGCALSFAAALGWQDRSAATFGLGLVFVLASAATGRVVGLRAALRELLDRQAEALRQSADVVERLRVAEVRGRIAGEVQHLVNHRVQGMVDRAEIARRIAPRDSALASQLVATVEQDGRAALDEMRTMLGVLRGSDLPGSPLAPAPGSPDPARQLGHLLGRRLEVVLLVGIGVLAVSEVLVAPGELPFASMALLAPLVTFLVAVRTGIRIAVAGLALALVVVTAVNHLVVRGGWGDYVFPVVLTVFAWLGGRLVRNQDALVDRARAGAAALERDAALRASAAETHERLRLARELHDVLAHTLMVMVVQAGAARRSLESGRPGADEAIRIVVDTGREASSELRRLLTLVDPPGQQGAEDTGLTPGLGDLGSLVDRARSSGLDAELVVEGRAVPLPGGLALAAYRVAQEAVTNVIRHSGASKVRLMLVYAPGLLEIEVRDDGMPRTGASVPPAGNGVTGMRERAALYSGELSVGPSPQGGYVVSATFPLSDLLQEQPV